MQMARSPNARDTKAMPTPSTYFPASMTTGISGRPGSVPTVRMLRG